MNKINKAIDRILRKELRDEAKGLMSKASDIDINLLLNLQSEDKLNIFCMELDRIKYDLVKSNIISRDEFPNFGEFFFEMKLEEDRDDLLNDLLDLNKPNKVKKTHSLKSLIKYINNKR